MIIPSLDLINGKVVRLYKGNYNQQFHYKYDPIFIIKKYQKFGAKYIHLVDLSKAKNPNKKQIYNLKKIIDVTSIPIQIGGGIRNKEDIDLFLKIGFNRIVIGSMAVKEPNKVKEWIKYYGANIIVLALDIIYKNNDKKFLMINGWQKKTKIIFENVLNDFLSYIKIKNILCTDINCDGTLKGPNINLYKELVKLYPEIKIQASGGVGTINDILSLKKSGVHSVITGRAFIENKIDIKDAILCWQKE